DLNFVALVELQVDLAARHGDFDALGLDGGIGHDFVATLEGGDAKRMRGDPGPQQLLGPGRALDMVGVRVGGNQHLALRQTKVHLADKVDDLFHGVEVANIDEKELGAAVDQVDVDAQAATGLVVQLDDVRKEIFALFHGVIPPRS